MKTPIDSAFEILFGKQKLIFPFILVIIGMFILLGSKEGLNLFELIKSEGYRLTGYIILGVGILWMYLGAFFRIWKRKRDRDFSDVDARRREREREGLDSDIILDEIRELKESQKDIDYQKLETIFEESKKKETENKKKVFESFESYFESLSGLLEKQARTADEKASILLDKGTSYSKNGIFFFVFTIIAWQVAAIYQGFKTQHIYGIVSCSVLFVFIEFLSAWFLKQYRHYVDTSTYLLKVKSIFDRYMLSYLALKSNGVGSNPEKCGHLIEILSEDIKWPESYLLKNADMSFAKEAMDTMTHFAKAMKSEAKNSSKKNESKE